MGLVEFFQQSPLRELDLDFGRDADRERDLVPLIDDSPEERATERKAGGPPPLTVGTTRDRHTWSHEDPTACFSR